MTKRNSKSSMSSKLFSSYLVFFLFCLIGFSCTGVFTPADSDGGTSADPEGGISADGDTQDGEILQDGFFDPCDSVDCGPHGDCIAAGQSPVCDCDEGYRPDGLTCVEEEPVDPCEGVVCGDNAHCDNGLCVCDPDHEGNPETGCTPIYTQEDMVRAELVEIARAELGFCEGTHDRPYMQWQPGYWCYDFVAWVYNECSYNLPTPLSLPVHYVDNLPAGWRPKAGDLIKFNIQHYGMVEDVSEDGQTIYTIEGNVNYCVTTRTVSQSSLEYYGYLENLF